MRRALRCLVVGLLLAAAAPAVGEPMRPLPGSRPRALGHLVETEPAPADLRLDGVTVVLGLRDRAGLDAVIAAQQDRHSPRYGHWLDLDEIADRFGPSRSEYERVRAWFVGQGFQVVRDAPSRIAIIVAGTAAQAETALATPIWLYRARDRTYHGPRVDPSVPESIGRSVGGLLGLDDLPKFRPLVRPLELVDTRTALGPADFAAAYSVAPLQNAGLTGAGRSIAVIARSDFNDSDVTAFGDRFGVPIRFERRFVDPNNPPGIRSDPGEETEVLIDTQWSGALAPEAQVNVVLSRPASLQGDIPESLADAVEKREGDIVTLSFGLCEPSSPTIATELFDAFYAVGNALGQTILVASGDSGGTECLPDEPDRLAVNALASSPHVIAVGGTSFALNPDGSVPSPVVESVWNDALGAGGGGESVVFARPRYQLATLANVANGRVLPDVSVAASPDNPGFFMVQDGQTRVIGGTSASAPALASVLALIAEQVARASGVTGLGQLLPTLYRLGSEQVRGLRAPVFRDVTIGSNAFDGHGGYPAGPGFDLATGWGAPLADALAAAVTGPGRCEPELGCLIPGQGPKRRACTGEWLVEQDTFTARHGLPLSRQTCHDGDPECDTDGAIDGRCTSSVALCLNVFDVRSPFLSRKGVPVCEPGPVRRVTLVSPGARTRDTVVAGDRDAIQAALGALPTLPTALRFACTAAVPVEIPLGASGQPGRITLRARVDGAHGRAMARLTLFCLPP
ncbi:MAG TPA: S53 family peptidase [Candidatus Binatus sp.]|nr:S53 family peptidase [Candidatus Binatus sp.]